MPFAGDDHVIVPVIAHFTGLAGQPRGDGAGAGQRVALAFLAAETAPHTAGFHPNHMHRHAQGFGHFMLNFRWVLGRAMHQHIAIFTGQGGSGLSFQIEMFLSAQFQHAFDHAGGGGDCGLWVATGVYAWPFLEPAVCGQRLINGQDRGGFLVGYGGLAGGLAGGKMGPCDYQKHRLSDIMHGPAGQKRFIMSRGRNVIRKRQIFGGQYRHHTGRLAHVGQVHRGNPPRRDGGQSKGQMQRACRGGDVINIPRLTCHMQAGGVMRKGFGDAHARTSCTETSAPRSSRK